MEMKQENIKDTKTESRFGDLKAILYLLQTNLEGFGSEVDKSYELLKLGVKTDLTRKIDETLKNPLEGFADMTLNLDDNIKHIIDFFVKSFIKKNTLIIKSAYRSKTSLNDLHYSIVLKEDNIENRFKVFSFLDKFDLMDISRRYPVYFQVVPEELMPKMRYTEEIAFE